MSDVTTVLTTSRLRLRPVDAADAEHVWSATRHPGFNDGMQWDQPASMEEIRPASVLRDLWRQSREYTWAIDRLDDGSFVGMISLREDTPKGTWRLGFWIHPDQWSHGYATEAAQAVLVLGFQELGATAIRAACAEWNEASGRVLTKIGMRSVGRNPRGLRKRGAWFTTREHEITRESREGVPPPVEIPIDGTLDLHTFHPRDVANLVADYLDACRERGILQVRLVHGKGTGALRATVHSILQRTPEVSSFRLAGEDAGGWGATIVILRARPARP